MFRPGYGGVVIRSAAALFGFVLGLVGGLLDFYSAYQFIAGGMGGSAMQYTSSGMAWGAGVAVLGVVVVTSAAVSVTPFGAEHMRAFGALMVAYGVLMLAVGFGMGGGTVSAMDPGSQTGFGMIMVGGLMAINGFMMLRAEMMFALRAPV